MAKLSFTEMLAARKAAQTNGTEAEAPKEEKASEEKVESAPVIEEASKPAGNSFLQRLQSAAANVKPAVEETPSFSPIKPVEPIPNVITAANLAASKLPTQETSALIGEDSVVVEQIRQRIADLQTMENGQIKESMKVLQGMLLANPSACALMLPEDTGLLVRALRKMTGNTQALMIANAKPSRKTKEALISGLEKMSVADLAKLASDQDWD